MTNFQCSITAIQFQHRNFRIYSATGEQLRKVHKQGATPLLTQDYSGGIEYRNAALEAVYHAEGRITPQVEGIRHEYTLTDHLGNGRVYFADRNGDGVGTAGDILQDEHYYPFGLRISDPRRSAGNPANRYQYNGKEWSEESGLGWYAYGARWYDPAVGRWWSVDPMAEKYLGVSGYHAVMNNPVRFYDYKGMTTVDYIYLDKSGKEIHRIEDPFVKHITFIDDDKKVQQIENWKAEGAFLPLNSPEYLEALGTTYDMSGVLGVFSESTKDLVTTGNILDSETGAPRFDIANEHGAILEINSRGIVDIGLRNTDNSPLNTSYKKNKYEYSEREVSVMHTHPNEGKRPTNHGHGVRTYHKDKGPSPHDKRYAEDQAKSGFYNIVVDKNNVYFYDSKKVVAIPLDKL